MKKILLTFLLALVATVIHAQTFTQGDFTYSTNSDGTVTCTGTSSQGASKTSLNIPGYTFNASTQTYYQVRQIASNAFRDNTTVTQVRIEPGVEVINDFAFYRCTNLAVVSLPSTITQVGQNLFFKCPITQINCAAETIPSTLTAYTLGGLGTVGTTRYWVEGTNAGYNAANANSAITGQFTVQKNAASAYDVVGNIGSTSPNYRCTVYAIVTNPWNPTTLRGGECKIIHATFASQNTTYTLEIPYNEDLNAQYASYAPLEIDDYAFQNNPTIKALRIYNVSNFKRIGTCAFQNCTNLATVTSCAKTIGNFAFNNCTNLTSVQLYGYSEASYGVQSLGTACFRNTKVSSVYIPSTLTTYNSGAFDSCPNLTKFTVSGSNTYFAASTSYGNALYSKDYTTLYQYPSGRNASYFNDEAPYALTKICSYAFKGNTVTNELHVPYGVKTIQTEAFGNMTSLKKLYIPSSVTTFNWNTFVNMTALTDFYFNLKSIPSTLTDSYAFNNIRSGCRLHIPKWRTQLYSSTSPWSTTFTGGMYEDSYDHMITYNNGSALNYYLGFTVSSTASYTDTKVQSAAADGQMCIVYGLVATEGSFTGTLTLPNTVSLRGKTYIVSEVQREVFRNQTLIKYVTGGAGIKKIGALSFAGLTGCTQGFNIPNPVEFGDSSLFNCWTPTITLGDRLERIGNDAFRQSAVRQVLMPPSVTTIGARIVAGDHQLDTIRLSPNITEIPTCGLGWCNARWIVIPYGVKKIGSQAFFSDNYGSGLDEPVRENVVVIPSSVTTIAHDAFQYARHLDAIFLNVNYGVFTSSKSDWARRVESASNDYNWSGHKLYVPAGQLEQYRNDSGINQCWSRGDIQHGAFDFTIDNNFWSTMYRMTVVDATNRKAKYVYNWGTGSSVINVANYRTDHNSGIQYTMVEVGDSCWVDRPGVTTVSFPSSSTITKICNNAFRNCTGLNTEVSIPQSITEIGKYAFYGCTSLPSVFLNRTSTTSIGTYMFNSSQQSILYVPLNQFYNIANQTSSWLSNTASNRRLLPYVKPTTEWSAISVPVSDDILLPSSGQFYYASGYTKANSSLVKTQIANSKGIKGGEGMVMKGTVGTVYRFRRKQDVSSYTYVAPSTNYLKGVSGASQTLTNTTAGPWYFKFDGEQFNRVTSSATVYSGEAYVQLTGADVSNSAVSAVYIDSDIVAYNLWINGTQVTSENCGNLSVISGVSGTVTYTPGTNTLKLSSATISTSSNHAIKHTISGLKIYLVGTNTVKTTSGSYMALELDESTTINGTGSLTASSAANIACRVYLGKTLTISSGCKTTFSGKTYGIQGTSSTSKLVVSGASTQVIAYGQSVASIYSIQPTLNNGLAVTAPAGAYFNSDGTVVYANGNRVYGENVVISKPTALRGDVDGDGEVAIADVSKLIDYLLSGNSSGVNLQAADCDNDGEVSISDVSKLIDYLLTGNW